MYDVVDLNLNKAPGFENVYELVTTKNTNRNSDDAYDSLVYVQSGTVKNNAATTNVEK